MFSLSGAAGGIAALEQICGAAITTPLPPMLVVQAAIRPEAALFVGEIVSCSVTVTNTSDSGLRAVERPTSQPIPSHI